MRSTPTPGRWPAVEHHDQLPGRRLGFVDVPDAAAACGSTARGRRTTGGSAPADLNLGLRYDLIWNAFAQNVDVPAVRDAGPSAGREQHAAARRLRVSDHRRTVHSRRHGAVLQRHPQHERAVAAESADDRRDSRQQRRAPRLRGEPIQRAAADLRPGAAAILQRQQPARMPAARSSGTGADSRLRARDAQPGRVRSASRISSGATRRSKSTTSTPAAATRSRSRTTSTSRSIPPPASPIRIRTPLIARSRCMASSG